MLDSKYSLYFLSLIFCSSLSLSYERHVPYPITNYLHNSKHKISDDIKVSYSIESVMIYNFQTSVNTNRF